MVRILTTGNWNRAQLRVSRVESSHAANPEIDRRIDQAWAEALARPGVKLFDGPMCRLESWNASPDSLQLQLSPTSYKSFVGTNLANSHLAEIYGKAALANPVGLSAAVLTADGFLVMGRRNASVAYYPNRIHPFAGCLEPADGDDLFAAVARELNEELSLSPADIGAIHCIGIVEDPALLQPEVIFSVRLTRNLAEVQRQVDADEHCGSWSILASAIAIKTAMDHPDFTPVAAGSLRLWARSEFGAEPGN